MKSLRRIWLVPAAACVWVVALSADRLFCPWQDKTWHSRTTMGILLALALGAYLLWIERDALRAHVASRFGPNVPTRFHKDIKPPLRRPPR